MSKPTVFVSYSHKDEVWKERLGPHLRMLEQAGGVGGVGRVRRPKVQGQRPREGQRSNPDESGLRRIQGQGNSKLRCRYGIHRSWKLEV